jgi:hypothetical protein
LSKSRPVLFFGVLLIFSLFSEASISTAQAAPVNTSISNLLISPNPAGSGYQISIIGSISPEPPPGYSYRAILLSTIDRNGNYRTLSVNSTHPGSGAFSFYWIPDITGAYLFIITYPGEPLGGINYTRCQRNATFTVDPSLPTPTSSPIPTQTPTTEWNSSSSPKTETTLNVNCQSTTTYTNFKVNIQGTLTSNNAGLSDSPIRLSYSVDGGNSWESLTFLTTDSTGTFQAVWTPLVTGTYFLRATYEGTSELSPANNIVHFSVLPVEDISVFSVASNSTVTALTFNSASQELSFKVGGETGTTGYLKVYISKLLMSDASNLKVYFDQELLQPATQSAGDSWLVSFTYPHSVHTVVLALNSGTSNIQPQTQNLQYIAAGVVGAILAIAVVMVLLKSNAKRKRV